MNTQLLEQMTSPCIREAIQNGYRTAIVAGGSTEQHGQHLPIGTDAMLAYQAAIAIAKELGKTLVAPVVRPGCSDHHMAYSGTISLPVSVFQSIVSSYCTSLSRHGFERIVLVTTHGGNTEAMRSIAPELDASLPCRVVFADIIDDPRLASAKIPLFGKLGVTPEQGGFHAGFEETSLLLAEENGRWADMASARVGFVGDSRKRVRELSARGAWSIAEISPLGVLGDPRCANAESGRAMLAAFVPIWVAIVREALDMAQEEYKY